MKGRVSWIQSCQVYIISVYIPSDQVSVLQTGLAIVTVADEQQYNNDRTLLLWIGKCVAIPLNKGVSVPARTSSAWLRCMAPHPNSMQIGIVLLASRISIALLCVSVGCGNIDMRCKLRENLTILPSEMLIKIQINLRHCISHLEPGCNHLRSTPSLWM